MTSTPTATPVPPETVVMFPDPNLEAAIREALGKRPGEEIVAGELTELTTLNVTSTLGRVDLTGIEHVVNLTLLYLSGGLPPRMQIDDLSPLPPSLI